MLVSGASSTCSCYIQSTTYTLAWLLSKTPEPVCVQICVSLLEPAASPSTIMRAAAHARQMHRACNKSCLVLVCLVLCVALAPLLFVSHTLQCEQLRAAPLQAAGAGAAGAVKQLKMH